MKNYKNNGLSKKLLVQIINDIDFGDYYNAEKNIKKYEELYGSNDYSKLSLAKYKNAIGEIEEAIEILEELIDNNAKNIGYVIYELAKIYENLNMEEKAIETYKKIDLTKHKDKNFVYLALGVILEKNFKHDDALYYFNKIVKNNSKLKESAKFHIAKIYVYLEKYKDAKNILDSIIIGNNKNLNSSILLLQAKIEKKLCNKKNYETKIDEILTKYNPSFIPALIEKLDILLSDNKIEEANKIFVKIKEPNADNMNYILVKALYYEKIHDYKTSKELYFKVIDSKDKVVNINEANFGIARINIIENNIPSAIEYLKQIIKEKDCYYNAALCQLIDIYIYLGKYNDAYELYRQMDSNLIYAEMKDQIKKIELELVKVLNINYVIERKMSYSKSQILNYDKDYAINHIINGHVESNFEKKSIFNSDVDVSILIDKVKPQLKQNNIVEIATMKKHRLYYPNIGFFNGEQLNYLMVVTLLHSNDIITMYPSNEYDAEINHEEEIQKQKIKKESRIDKFNKKYGI